MDNGSVDAWGMQREMCLRAGPDNDGNPRRPPFDPVLAAFRIKGALSAAHLVTAAGLMVDRTDVLHARLRRSAGRFVSTPETGAAGVPIVTADLTGQAPPDQRRRLQHLIGGLRSGLNDMQDGPLGTIVLVRTDDHEHILCAMFDHSVMDLYAVSSWLRRLGRVYGRLAAGDVPGAEVAARPDIDFLPYVREQLADTGERAAAEQFWRSAAGTGVPLEMPGGRWRPWREMRSGNHLTHEFPAADVRALARVCQVTGGSRPYVFLGAFSLVLAGAAGTEFAPVTYVRHGHEAGEPAPTGPLYESVITCAPRPPGGPAASWLADFVAVNLAAPHMRGWALVDFGGLDSTMELRRYMINTPFPSGKLRLGELRAERVPPDEVLPAGPPSVRHNNGIRLFAWSWDRLLAVLQHDPRDLPDGVALLAATGAVLRAVAERPATPVADVMAMAARQMAAAPRAAPLTAPPGTA